MEFKNLEFENLEFESSEFEHSDFENLNSEYSEFANSEFAKSSPTSIILGFQLSIGFCQLISYKTLICIYELFYLAWTFRDYVFGVGWGKKPFLKSIQVN